MPTVWRLAPAWSGSQRRHCAASWRGDRRQEAASAAGFFATLREAFFLVAFFAVFFAAFFLVAFFAVFLTAFFRVAFFATFFRVARSEARRVGKECFGTGGSGLSPYH